MRRMLRLPEVMERVGLSRSSIYAYIEKGKFPAQIHLGERCVAWNSEDIEEWIQEKIEESKTNTRK